MACSVRPCGSAIPKPSVNFSERSKMNKPFSYLFNSTIAALALALALADTASADSLWKDGASRPMSSEKKAYCVGDILTILIQENNGATRQNNTTTSKKASVNA